MKSKPVEQLSPYALGRSIEDSRMIGGIRSIIKSILLFLVVSNVCQAAAVRQVSVEEMLENCDFIFEGVVIKNEVMRGKRKRQIVTAVTFEITDIIKGNYSEKIIELSYLGGSLGGATLTVSDMQIPPIGLRGYFFVESLDREQVHPLYGWQQGNYFIKTDAGANGEIVTTNDNNAVYGIDVSETNKQFSSKLSRGYASGMRTYKNSINEKPLSPDEFKKYLNSLLNTISVSVVFWPKL